MRSKNTSESIFTAMIILSILSVLSSDPASASYRYHFDNATACSCSIPGAYLMSGGSSTGLSAACAYYHEPEVNVKGAYMIKLTSSVTSWSEAESTRNALKLHKEQQYRPRLASIRQSDSTVIVESFEKADSFSLIYRSKNVGHEYRNPEKKQFEYIVNRQVRYDDYALITIEGRWRTVGEEPKDRSVIETVNAMENCMKKLIDNSLDDGTSKFRGRLLVEDKPLKNIRITEQEKKGEKSTTSDADGEFSLDVDDPENFRFVLELVYHKEGSDYFRLIRNHREEPIRLIFDIKGGKIAMITIDVGNMKVPVHYTGRTDDPDISIDLAEDIKRSQISVIRLDKFLPAEEGLLGPLINYIHFSEALEYYKDSLGTDLSKRTLDILLYRDEDTSYNYENDRSWIIMSKQYSNYDNEYRPFIAYHEFSHYVQHMLYGKIFEEALDSSDINHGGYANKKTSDSFSEGFAAFMSTIIANHYKRYWTNDSLQKLASLYPLSGSLETDWKAWERQGKAEEFAVAGILWDFVDGKEEVKKNLDIIRPHLREVMEEFMDDADMNKDGSLNRQEFLYSLIMQKINLNLDDYLEPYELKRLNDSEVIESIRKSGLMDPDGSMPCENFWRYMTSNWDEIEADWKAEDIESYMNTPQRITIDDMMGEVMNLSDDDDADMTFDQIWNVLKKPHADFTEIYASLVKITNKSSTDKIFIEHGFFISTSQGNGRYDEGEPYQDKDKDGTRDDDEPYADLGNMSFREGYKIGTASNYNRLSRRSSEPLQGEYVKVNKEIQYFTLTYTIYDTDYHGLKLPSRIYSIRAGNKDGLIYVPMQKDAKIKIEVEGTVTKNPLVITSAEFEKRYAESIRKGFFLEHEFDYEGQPVRYDDPFTKTRDESAGWKLVLGIVLAISAIIIFGKRKRYQRKARAHARKAED